MAPASGDTQDNSGLGPVGTGSHRVKEGECLLSIAAQYGHFWQTIWHDSANNELREQRIDPHKVLPDDRITIPPVRKKQVGCAVESRHRFKRKGTPTRLNLQFLHTEIGLESAPPVQTPDPDELHAVYEDPEPTEPAKPEPRSGTPYRLVVDNVVSEGKTDRDGKISIPIPTNASKAELTLDPGTEQETVVPILIGNLDPITEDSGLIQRLQNLGFPTTDDPASLALALAEFQAANDLEADGQKSQETRDKLKEAHGE